MTCFYRIRNNDNIKNITIAIVFHFRYIDKVLIEQYKQGDGNEL